MSGRLIQKLREKPQYTAITLTCVVLFAVLTASGRVTYFSDDDVALNMIAAGAFSPDSQYLVYINILYGWFLKALYQMIPAVNWFLWCSLIQNLSAVTCICLLFGRRLNVPQGILLSMLFTFLFAYDFYITLQYTRNVSLYAVAGYLLVLFAVKRKRKSAMIPGTCFVLLAAMFRKDAFLITVPLFLAVLFVHLVFSGNGDGKRPFREVLTALLPVLLALAFIRIDAALYAGNPGWDHYRTRKAVLAEIQDRGAVDFTGHVELYEEAGFRASAMNMITNWLDNDPEVFSLERLQALSGVKQSYDPIHLRFAPDRLFEMSRYVTGILFLEHGWLPSVFLVLMLFFLFRDRRKQLWMSLLSGILAFAMYYYLFCYSRLGWHVEIAVWLPMTLLPAGDLLSDDDAALFPAPHGAKRMYLAFAAWLSVLLVTCLVHVYRDPWEPRFSMQLNVAMTGEKAKALYDRIREDRDHFYIGGLALCEGYWGEESVFDINGMCRNRFENICHLGNWVAGSPAGMYHANAHGITNPMRALYERDDTLLVSPEDEAQRILYFLREYYHPGLTLEKTDEVSGTGIWKVSVP